MHNRVPNCVQLHHQIDQAFPLILRATLKNYGSSLGMMLPRIGENIFFGGGGGGGGGGGRKSYMPDMD